MTDGKYGSIEMKLSALSLKNPQSLPTSRVRLLERTKFLTVQNPCDFIGRIIRVAAKSIPIAPKYPTLIS